MHTTHVGHIIYGMWLGGLFNMYVNCTVVLYILHLFVTTKTSLLAMRIGHVTVSCLV